MTDLASSTGEERIREKRIAASARFVGWLITVMGATAGLISVIVIISVVFIALRGQTIPPELSNWGGIILGFYFGQFVNLLKDYMGVVDASARNQ
jgi:uncharacterized membrane protein AbrB (regulator of aidB expression)